jgi:hypothetical protein
VKCRKKFSLWGFISFVHSRSLDMYLRECRKAPRDRIDGA